MRARLLPEAPDAGIPAVTAKLPFERLTVRDAGGAAGFTYSDWLGFDLGRPILASCGPICSSSSSLRSPSMHRP